MRKLVSLVGIVLILLVACSVVPEEPVVPVDPPVDPVDPVDPPEKLVSEVKWAGIRVSSYGMRDAFGEMPDVATMSGFAGKMESCYEGAAGTGRRTATRIIWTSSTRWGTRFGCRSSRATRTWRRWWSW